MQEASRTHQQFTVSTLSSPDDINQSEEDMQDLDQSAEDRLTRLQSQYKIVCAQKVIHNECYPMNVIIIPYHHS